MVSQAAGEKVKRCEGDKGVKGVKVLAQRQNRYNRNKSFTRLRVR